MTLLTHPHSSRYVFEIFLIKLVFQNDRQER